MAIHMMGDAMNANTAADIDEDIDEADILSDEQDPWADEPTLPWHREGRAIISMCDGWF